MTLLFTLLYVSCRRYKVHLHYLEEILVEVNLGLYFEYFC